MLSAQIDLKANSYANMVFSSYESYNLGDIVSVGGYKGYISSIEQNGIIYIYRCKPIWEDENTIYNAYKGYVTVRELFVDLCSDMNLSLDITNISTDSTLNEKIYTDFFSTGTIPELLTRICSALSYSWFVYWKENNTKPTLKLVKPAKVNADTYSNTISQTIDKAMLPPCYISVVTTPEITASTETVLGDGNTEFEPATQEFTTPYLEGTAEAQATVKEIDPETGEEVEVPYDSWHILERELAVKELTWTQKSPIGKWTDVQRADNAKVKAVAHNWPMYWFKDDGIGLSIPPESKVKILSTVLDTAQKRPTKAEAIAAYPQLTYLFPGKYDIWSWVGVWPDVSRYDKRTMDISYEKQLVWRGDKKNNRQNDWGEE